MSDQVRTEDVGTYQMLWDCEACGTTKLLGLTHRHCPNCGSPQNPKKRYFPSDEEKVAVEDHPFTGKDLECPACYTPNGASAKNCGGCGYPLADAKAVGTRENIVHGEGEAFAGETGADVLAAERAARARLVAESQGKAPQQADKPKFQLTRRRKIIAVAIFAVLLLVFLFTRKREVQLEVTGHSWSREIEIETYGEVDESAWCDRVPASGKVTSRRSEVKDKKKVPDGETCKVRKQDNGDGTFKDVKECKPKYREEPIYADKCYYRIDRWHHARTLDAQGDALTPEPSWPVVELRKTGTGNCRGCEREGSRDESYTVHFQYDDDTDTCRFGYERWKSIAVGDRFAAEAGRLTGNLDCDSLEAQ